MERLYHLHFGMFKKKRFEWNLNDDNDNDDVCKTLYYFGV